MYVILFIFIRDRARLSYWVINQYHAKFLFIQIQII
jgi:hypothetical protein